MPRGIPKKRSSLTSRLASLAKQLNTLTAEVEQAEAYKRAIDSVKPRAPRVAAAAPKRRKKRARRKPAAE